MRASLLASQWMCFTRRSWVRAGRTAFHRNCVVGIVTTYALQFSHSQKYPLLFYFKFLNLILCAWVVLPAWIHACLVPKMPERVHDPLELEYRQLWVAMRATLSVEPGCHHWVNFPAHAPSHIKIQGTVEVLDGNGKGSLQRWLNYTPKMPACCIQF